MCGNISMPLPFPMSRAAVTMAHRVRSRTADSAENKKTKGTPRRLTEKIAIMRRREHEQSAAFQKAMKSIFEVCSGFVPSLLSCLN